jgi:hypothetical protein
LIRLSFAKIVSSKHERGGAKLHRNLLILHLLQKARIEQNHKCLEPTTVDEQSHHQVQSMTIDELNVEDDHDQQAINFEPLLQLAFATDAAAEIDDDDDRMDTTTTSLIVPELFDLDNRHCCSTANDDDHVVSPRPPPSDDVDDEESCSSSASSSSSDEESGNCSRNGVNTNSSSTNEFLNKRKQRKRKPPPLPSPTSSSSTNHHWTGTSRKKPCSEQIENASSSRQLSGLISVFSQGFNVAAAGSKDRSLSCPSVVRLACNPLICK